MESRVMVKEKEVGAEEMAAVHRIGLFLQTKHDRLHL